VTRRKKHSLIAGISLSTLAAALTFWFGAYPMAQDAYAAWHRYQGLLIEVCELRRGQDWIAATIYKRPFTDGRDTCAEE
jgi:hypothetical protein